MSLTKRIYESQESRRYTYNELLEKVKVLDQKIKDLESKNKGV